MQLLRHSLIIKYSGVKKVVESIQEAVDQRMGPYMCDNSLEESKAEQTDFLNILKGFKKAADEKRVNESMLLGKTQK